MTRGFKSALRTLLVLLITVYPYLFLLLRPPVVRYSDAVTIIDTRVGGIDISLAASPRSGARALSEPLPTPP
jgi:hypothetical protein